MDVYENKIAAEEGIVAAVPAVDVSRIY